MVFVVTCQLFKIFGNDTSLLSVVNDEREIFENISGDLRIASEWTY